MITPFGKAIRKARIDLGVTMSQMAEEIGYPPSYLSMLETGRKHINEDALRKILEYFVFTGVDTKDFTYLSRISDIM